MGEHLGIVAAGFFTGEIIEMSFLSFKLNQQHQSKINA